MNFQRRAFSYQHGDSAHLTEFQRDLNIGGKKTIFDCARVGAVSLDDLLERVGNSPQTSRELLRSGGTDGPTFNQTIVPAIIFNDAPARRFTTRINSQYAHKTLRKLENGGQYTTASRGTIAFFLELLSLWLPEFLHPRDAPTGLWPPAQGCRFGYPGYRLDRVFNPNGVESKPDTSSFGYGIRTGSTPLGSDSWMSIYSQGSRGGNPGLEGATALRLYSKHLSGKKQLTSR